MRRDGTQGGGGTGQKWRKKKGGGGQGKNELVWRGDYV
jgi:hypothetical protein